MQLDDILIRPIITEKSMKETGLDRFTFEVNIQAKKPEIRRAIEKRFNVNVKKLETLIVKGRKKRVGKKRISVKLAPWKKAIVKLASGQKIDLFEGLENEPKA